MRITCSIFCVLSSVATVSAQVAVSAPLVGGAAFAGAAYAPALVPGSDAWPGLARSVGGAIGAAALTLSHQQTSTEIDVQWQLSCFAVATGTATAEADVRFELTSPMLQTGQLLIEWLPTQVGTGQAVLSIDVYDDGYVDSTGSAAIPVTFQQFPLVVRVHVVTSAQGITYQGPWGSSWSLTGRAAGELRMRFVPTHANVTILATQACAAAPALMARGNLTQGVDLEALCPPSDELALFALGFQPANVPLPLSLTCRLLLDPVVVFAHSLPPDGTAQQVVAVPITLRPTFFLAQLIAFDLDTMTLTASDALQINIQ